MIRALIRSLVMFLLRTPALRFLALMCVYGAVLGLSIFFAYQLRFDFIVPDNIERNMLSVCAITVAVQLVCLFLFHQFDGLLTYFSTPDLRRLLSACSLATLVIAALRFTMRRHRCAASGCHSHRLHSEYCRHWCVTTFVSRLAPFRLRPGGSDDR